MTTIDFDETIKFYERRFLEENSPPNLLLSSEFDEFEFIKVNGLSNFWNFNKHTDELYERFKGILSGVANYQKYFLLIIIGSNQKVDTYYSLDTINTCSSLLRGMLPGIKIDKEKSTNQIKSYRNLGSCLQNWVKSVGLISGIPSIKIVKEESQFISRYEYLAKSLRGCNWFVAIKSFSQASENIANERDELLSKIELVSANIKAQFQQSRQISIPVTNRTSQTHSESITGEQLNRKAQYLVEMLEFSQQRYESMLRTGQWLTSISFGAENINTTNKIAALLKGFSSGVESKPDPIRSHICAQRITKFSTTDYATYLSSEELALWMCPFHEEVFGFEIHDPINLDVNSNTTGQDVIGIGNILWDHVPTGQVYQIDINDFSRHGVVFGITGSGKTTSVMQILHRCWQSKNKIPFLVIEPAKTEYRGLLSSRNDQKLGIIPNLRVFTFGNENIAPFRLNPFEFELTDNPDHTLLNTHIDFLKAVFNAAFILYAPMPYILEIALNEIYEDKGWSLATGKNTRMPNDQWKDRDKYPIFPTLSDLAIKIEEITKKLGYESDIESDVIAGLKVRINGLRIGSKGLMLDVARGYSIKELLAQPSVIELESIGNDEEKSFLIGLLLSRIYEYRRINSNSNPNTLTHLLVIEEAHRLLKKTNTHVNIEESNLRAQAIETFSNMLSEIRHYGQGVLVSEQIPTKLCDDVIKNSNLKIIHRLLAKDDRETVAATMNMEEKQARFFSILKRGEAVVFSENDDHPCLIKVDDFKQKNVILSVSDNDIQKKAQNYLDLSPYHSIIDFSEYGLELNKYGVINPTIYKRVIQFSEKVNEKKFFGGVILRVLFSKEGIAELINNCEQQVISTFGQKDITETLDVLKVYFLIGTQRLIERLSKARYFYYNESEELRKLLSKILISTVSPISRNTNHPEIEKFSEILQKKLRLPNGPFPGCKLCKNKCIFLPFVQDCMLVSDQDYFYELLNKGENDQSFKNIRSFIKGSVQEWLDNENRIVDDISFCVALNFISRCEFDNYAQETFSKKIFDSIYKFKDKGLDIE